MIRSNLNARNALVKIQIIINSTCSSISSYSTTTSSPPSIVDKGKGRELETESGSKENQRTDRLDGRKRVTREKNGIASSSAVTLDKLPLNLENRSQEFNTTTATPTPPPEPVSIPPIGSSKTNHKKKSIIKEKVKPFIPSQLPIKRSTPNLSEEVLRTKILSIDGTTAFQSLQSYRKLLIEKELLNELELVRSVIIGFIELKEFSCALRFLKETIKVLKKDSNFNPLQLVYLFDGSLRSLLKQHKEDWIILFTQLAITNSILSPFILFSRIKALSSQSRHAEVTITFNLFLSTGFEPTGEIYDEIVLSQLLNGNLVAAQQTLAKKSEFGFGSNSTTCLALLEGMRRFGGNLQMEEKILSDRSGFGEDGKYLRSDSIILNRLLSVRIERGDFASAIEILDWFNLDDLPFDLALPLERVIVNDGVEEGLKPLPDLATFTILIGLSRRMKRLDCALDLFTQSQELKLGLNEYLLGSIVNSLCSGSQVLIAKKFFLALTEGKARLPNRPLDKIGKFRVTNIIFDSLWKGILRVEGIEGANSIISLLLSSSHYSDIIITDSIVTSLLYHLTRESKRSTSAAITKICTGMIMRISYLTKGGRKPTITDLNILLESAWQQERFKVQSGNNYLNRRMEKRPISIEPISTTYSSSSLPVREPTTPPLPTALAKIQSSLSSRSLTNDSTTTRLLLRNTIAFESIESRWSFIQTEVIDKGFKPTYLHIAYIIRAYIVEGDVTGARESVERGVKMGVLPHISWYGILIGGCNRLGKFIESKELFKEMLKSGLTIDKRLFITLALERAQKGNLEGMNQIQSQILDFLGEDVSDDLIFIGIKYRAFVSRGDLLRAQFYISKKLLNPAIKMDSGLLKILERTGKWLRNKMNRSNRGLISKFSQKDLEIIFKIWSSNYNLARKIFRKQESMLVASSVEKLDKFWIRSDRRGTSTGTTVNIRGIGRKKRIIKKKSIVQARKGGGTHDSAICARK